MYGPLAQPASDTTDGIGRAGSLRPTHFESTEIIIADKLIETT